METTQVQDILLTDNYDLAISASGDFEIGYSDQQHVILLIETGVGSWKQFPTIGVGIEQYSGSSGTGLRIRNEINNSLKNDGYSNVSVELVQIPDGTFRYNINALRIR